MSSSETLYPTADYSPTSIDPSVTQELLAEDTLATPNNSPVVGERQLSRGILRHVGHSIYVLTHRAYRQEVRERARDVLYDVEGNTRVKQILPPRTRDAMSAHERRHNASWLALDIASRIRNIRRYRRALGGASITLTGTAIHDAPNLLPPEVMAVEQQHVSVEGPPSHEDFIPVIVTLGSSRS